MANPFEEFDLDPREGISAITQRLKELAEDATDERERERIRAAWEELTLHPGRRLRAALGAHPDSRAALGSPPALPRPRVTATELGLRDLAARPSVSASVPSEVRRLAGDEDAAPSLDDDPHF